MYITYIIIGCKLSVQWVLQLVNTWLLLRRMSADISRFYWHVLINILIDALGLSHTKQITNLNRHILIIVSGEFFAPMLVLEILNQFWSDFR